MRNFGLAAPAAIGVALHAVLVSCHVVSLDLGGQGLPKHGFRWCLRLFVRPAPNNRVELKGAGIMPYTTTGHAVPQNFHGVKLILVPGSRIPDIHGDISCFNGVLRFSGNRETTLAVRALGHALDNSDMILESGPYATAVVNCGNISGITTVGSLLNAPASGEAVSTLSPVDSPRLPLYAGLSAAWIVTGVAFCARTSKHGRTWMIVHRSAFFLSIPALMESAINVGSLTIGENGDVLRRVANIAACWKVICFWHTMLVEPTGPSGEHEHLTVPLKLLLSAYLIIGSSARTQLDTSRRYGNTRKEDVGMHFVVAHVLGFVVSIIAFCKVNRYVRISTSAGHKHNVSMYQQLRGLSVIATVVLLGSNVVEVFEHSLQSSSTWGSHYVYADAIPQGSFLLCSMMLLTICSTDAGEHCKYIVPELQQEAAIIGNTSPTPVLDDGARGGPKSDVFKPRALSRKAHGNQENDAQ